MARKQPERWANDILTTAQAAELAGLDRSHFWRLVKEGKGPRHQILKAGKKPMVLIVRADLEAWMADRDR